MWTIKCTQVSEYKFSFVGSIFSENDNLRKPVNHKTPPNQGADSHDNKPFLGFLAALTAVEAVTDNTLTEEYAETLQVNSLWRFKLFAAISQRQFLRWEMKSYLTRPDQAGYFSTLFRDRGFIVIVQNTTGLFDAWQIMQEIWQV